MQSFRSVELVLDFLKNKQNSLEGKTKELIAAYTKSVKRRMARRLGMFQNFYLLNYSYRQEEMKIFSATVKYLRATRQKRFSKSTKNDDGLC